MCGAPCWSLSRWLAVISVKWVLDLLLFHLHRQTRPDHSPNCPPATNQTSLFTTGDSVMNSLLNKKLHVKLIDCFLSVKGTADDCVWSFSNILLYPDTHRQGPSFQKSGGAGGGERAGGRKWTSSRAASTQRHGYRRAAIETTAWSETAPHTHVVSLFPATTLTVNTSTSSCLTHNLTSGDRYRPSMSSERTVLVHPVLLEICLSCRLVQKASPRFFRGGTSSSLQPAACELHHGMWSVHDAPLSSRHIITRMSSVLFTCADSQIPHDVERFTFNTAF